MGRRSFNEPPDRIVEELQGRFGVREPGVQAALRSFRPRNDMIDILQVDDHHEVTETPQHALVTSSLL